MASDVLTVMDALHLKKRRLSGGAMGACISLVLANASVAARHGRYASLSAMPDDFDDFVTAVSHMMKTEPNHTAHDLARITVPVAIVQSEYDEFIKPEHAEYLARTIPGAELAHLTNVRHFAPLQRPDDFNQVLFGFLTRLRA